MSTIINSLHLNNRNQAFCCLTNCKIIKISSIIGLLIFLTLAMSGCAEEVVVETPQEVIFSISKEKQNLYLSEMQTKLDEFYWRYDQDTVTFEQGAMPSENSDNYEKYKLCFEASKVSYAGKESMTAVIAAISLLYYNGDAGGTGYFYFVDDEMSGVYYSAPYDDSTIFSLKDRNVFLNDIQFEQYESSAIFDNYTKSAPGITLTGLDSEGSDGKGNKLFASLDLEKRAIYIYTFVRSFTLIDTIKIEEQYYPMSAAFIKNKTGADTLAVLIGDIPSESSEFSDDHTEDEILRLNSKHILFYDKNYKEYSRLELNSTEYTMIKYEDESIILGASNGLEYYTSNGATWERSSKTQFPHSIKSYLKTTISGDTKVYLMSDGQDLYMYIKNSGSFINIWRTHISIENFMGSIHAGDLNHDGVKEIYICDNTNTVIRYILSPKGLVPQNSDILYGERIYAADFNSDGKDDYIKVVNPETNEFFLFLAND